MDGNLKYASFVLDPELFSLGFPSSVFVLRKRLESIDLLKCISSPVRLTILEVLNKEPSLAFSEIMKGIKMRRGSSGPLNYHLKELIENGLVARDTVEGEGKYRVTGLGKHLVEKIEEIRGFMLEEEYKWRVITSNLTIEPYKKYSIVKSLRDETGIPHSQALRVAQEVEKRLMKTGERIFLSSWIRDIANSVLLEEGLVDYRNSYSRVGVPIHDLEKMMKRWDLARVRNRVVKSSLEQLVFYRALPKGISKAHAEGVIHLSHFFAWPAHLEVLYHDLRFFIDNGFIPKPRGRGGVKRKASIYKAVFGVIDIFSHSKDFALSQVFNHFNTFLAPFSVGVDNSTLEALIENLLYLLSAEIGESGHGYPALSLDLGIPEHLEDSYGDFIGEASLITKKVLEALCRLRRNEHPLTHPTLILNSYRGFDEEDEENFYEAVRNHVPVLMTDQSLNWQNGAGLYSPTLLRSEENFSEDPRGRCIVSVAGINLPVLVMKEREEHKAEEKLGALSGLLVRWFKQKGRRVLADLWTNGSPLGIKREPYLSMKDSKFIFSLIGGEATARLRLNSSRRTELDENILDIMEKTRECITRYFPDEEKQGTFDVSSCFTDLNIYNATTAAIKRLDRRRGFRIEDFNVTDPQSYFRSIKPKNRFRVQGEIQPKFRGGHFLNVHLKPDPLTPIIPEETFHNMMSLMHDSNVGFYSLTYDYTYCSFCSTISPMIEHETCPNCESPHRYLNAYGRLFGNYQPIWDLDDSVKREYSRRKRYSSIDLA